MGRGFWIVGEVGSFGYFEENGRGYWELMEKERNMGRETVGGEFEKIFVG